MTDRPNVTSSGATGPARSARSNSSNWSSAPAQKAIGSMTSSAAHNGTPSAAITVVTR